MFEISDFAKGLSSVIGGFLLHFSLGTIFTFGNMSPYIASYLKYRTNDTWVTNSHMVWIFSIAIFCQGFTMPLGGLLEKKLNPRIICWLGSWTMSFGTIITYYAIQQNLWCVLITYGFLFGVGTGLTYSVAIATPLKFFPNNKGLVAGSVVAGYGLGSSIFNLIQNKYINPYNISPNSSSTIEKYFTDSKVLDNVPFCFVVIGLIYAAIQLLGVILIMKPLDEKLTKEENNLFFEPRSENKELVEYSVVKSLKDSRFLLLWTTFLFNGMAILTILSLYKSFGQTFINNDSFISIVGAAASIFNGGGRLIWGRLFDILEYKKIMTILTISLTTVMGTFYLCSMIKSVIGAQIMFGIWVCLLFFCLSGSFSIFPANTSQCFGSENMAITYGFIFTGYAVSSIIGALIISIYLHIFHYWGQFIIATIFPILSLILTQFYPPCYLSKKFC